VFVEGDAAAAAELIRQEAPAPDGVEVLVDAPYDVITSLRYPWADAIRSSDLPKTING
jgi:hypothetical protein